MVTRTYVVRNSVDGKFDTYHVDPDNFTSATVRNAVEGNQGTSAGKKNSNRDTDRKTGEDRSST